MPTEAPARPAVASPAKAGRGAVRRLAWSEKVAISVLLGLVFMAVIAFGASEIATACLFSGVYAAYLIGLLATCSWARRDLARLRGLAVQGGLFALLLLAVLWSLGPWGPGGAHPVWSYVPDHMAAIAVDRSALLLSVVQLLGLACLFVAARVIGASEARGRWFLRIAVLAIGVYATLAFLDHVGLRRTPRLAATLLSPNSAATVFGGGLLLAVAATINRVRRQRGLTMLRRGDPETVACLAIVGVLATSLLLTASRAGLAATLVGLGVMLVAEAIAQRQRLRVVAGLGVMALVLTLGALSLRSSDLVAERLGKTDQDLAARVSIFTPHWEAFQSSPWFGFGLGSFPTVNQLIVTPENLRVLYQVRAVHNLYLQWLEEGGVAGAAAMALLFIALIWPILRGSLREGTAATWARATACGALVFLLHGVTDFALQAPAIQALAALLLGVVGSMAAGVGSSRQADPRLSWAAGLAAGGVVLASILVTAPLMASRLGGDLSAWPTAPAEALARRIEIGLRQAKPDQAELDRLDRLSAREIGLRPASGGAWLRRAAVEAARGRQEASNVALERSFAVAPLQTSLFVQRTRFAYEHWDLLSQSARETTIYQLKTEWPRRPKKPLIAMANSVRNPAGRVGMALQISVLRMAPPTP